MSGEKDGFEAKLAREMASFRFEPRQPSLQADPYTTYRFLRDNDPVHFRSHRGDWILTRYADVLMVLRDERFGQPAASLEATNSEPHFELPAQLDPATRNLVHLRHKSLSLLNLWLNGRNPPAHTRLRKLFQQAFARRTIESLRPRIQVLTDSLINQVEGAGTMDIVADLAFPLPAMVIAGILGAPVEDHPLFKRWSLDLSGLLDIDPPRAATERAVMAMLGFMEYFRRLIIEREKQPRDDFISTLISAHREEQLSADELLSFSVMLMFGGHETTQILISNGALALLNHPHQLRLLQNDPALIGTAVEELLRYDGAAQFVSRIALEDVALRGKAIRKGQRLYLMLAAANRDPEQFPQPDKLDITRRPNEHLAFGSGIHYCLGAELSRVEAQIALGTLVRRLPRLALQPTALEWRGVFARRGLKALPVTF